MPAPTSTPAPAPVLTVHQVIRSYGRVLEDGWGRTVFERQRYRVRGGDWGRGSQREWVQRAHGQGLADSGPAWAVLGACLAVLGAEDDDCLHLRMSEPAAGILHAAIVCEDLTPFRGAAVDLVREVMPALRRAEVEVRGRHSMRHMFRRIADTVPGDRIPLLGEAVANARAGREAARLEPQPAPVTEPGWSTDYGHSPTFGTSAVAFTHTSPSGDPEGTTYVVQLPPEPDRHGELIAVLLAYRYGKAHGVPSRVFYTDARDTGAQLRRFVEEGRDGAACSAALRAAAHGLDDAELLGLDIRWVYRHSTPAGRLVDAAIRDLYRGHVPPGSLLRVDELLDQ
ncbi:hypothetical protein ABZ499_27525 [Streptomyces sp. NPDC019990]|uniref:hypothetical protein n=1 Tax=Streptomyces sp. NPDC019990 TaxID=3154693 RepID=UPI0033E6C0EB